MISHFFTNRICLDIVTLTMMLATPDGQNWQNMENDRPSFFLVL